MERLNVLKKINQARQKIKAMELKKEGKNNYSNYNYFTPEQVDQIVNEATKDLELVNTYDLTRTELGLTAQLQITDLESGESETFSLATEIPQMSATNAAQQLGGAMTYSKRYLLMNAYDITDNSLDFDSQEPKKETKKTEKTEKKNDNLRPDGTPKKWLNKWDIQKINELPEYWEVIKWAKGKGITTVKELRKYYMFKKETANELETDLNQ